MFAANILLFILIVGGILPREASLFLALGLAIYFIFASLEDSVVFFVFSIPLFLALPIAETFDNLNTWRILSATIFLKWLIKQALNYKYEILNKTRKFQMPKFKTETKLLILLLFLAVLSVIPAGDKILAIKRIIYFVNLSFVGMVIYDLVGKNQDFEKRLIESMAIPVFIVTVVGFLQLLSTYFIDVYQFMRLWGEEIQCRQFGNEWCYIAVNLGNTWLAYYGEQLSLRVFSLFPDSHSFPQFVLLGLPSVFAVSLWPLFEKLDMRKWTLKKMIRIRVSMNIVWVPAIFLIAILSGTRGIWAASLGVVLLAFGISYWMKKTDIDRGYLDLFKYISLYLIGFFMLFAVAYPIFVSPQFLLSKGDWGLLGNRIRSIIDFGETSNAQRIEIWKKTGESISENPILGIGIGNYPVVLNQDLRLSRAGSSAHNIYLHMAAEMGLGALFVAIWFLWLLFRKIYYNFISSQDPASVAYFGSCLLFIPWILAYSLTDIALFDERAFLFFVTQVSLILGIKK